ncbi:hypothetical protein MKZ38_006225 [Zalerion maritima]|uniref:Carbohydrate kinase FGGY C-terminal domain-containing protein n=1 Tax=Zalerion maritima TaxID=339359 RepID=A0AAD5WU06_9PEZI|nr:hypothetical protein MKZ38_006225 [Zalerion maritima]
MAQPDYYIGIDVGTGSARACIIDSTGEIKGLASNNIRQWQPQTGYYVILIPPAPPVTIYSEGVTDTVYQEQSTVDIWRAICHCVKTVVADSNIPASSIKGMGFDATCSLAVLDKETDEPVCVAGPSFTHDAASISEPEEKDLVRNVVLWLDHRPESETEEINATNHPLLKYVGGTMSIEMEIPKVLWLKRNMPADKWDRCKFYDLADALTHLATGGEERSFCSTVCKQGYVPVATDGCVKGWQPDFYEKIGLGEMIDDKFEKMGGVDGVNGKWLSAGELVGTLCDKAAKELGIPAGIAIGSGVIDAYAGWIGTVGAKVDLPSTAEATGESLAFTRLAAVAGTSTCHLAMSKEAVFVPGVWGPYNNVVLPGFWMAEGGQSATGALLNHVLETHPSHKQALAKAEEGKKNVYDYLNDHLEELKQKAGAPNLSYLGRHLFFYGDLWGNRSPVADPNMRGSLVGMSSDTSIDNLALIYYATMEFIALQTRQIVMAMNESGHSLGSIFMSGSQCRNPVLMDLMATACEIPVVIPEYVFAAVVHGAAMLGAKAANKDEGLWSIMERMTKPGKVVWPGTDANVKKLLMAKYDVFQRQMNAQKEYKQVKNKTRAHCAFCHRTIPEFPTCIQPDPHFPTTSLQSPNMSLFGQNPQAGGGGGGLFGNTSNAPKPVGSLFGASTLGGSSTAGSTTGSGLFGQPPAQQPQQQQQTGGASIFGAPRPAGTSSFLGGGAAQNQQQQPQQQQQQPQKPSLFGTGGLGGSTMGIPAASTQPAQNAPAASTAGPDPSKSTAQATGAYFDSLLQKSKKQAEGETPLEDLPSLQLGLGDLRQRLKKLGPRKEDGALDGKAHYLLAGSGVDAGAAAKDLSFLGIPAGRIERAVGTAPSDIDVDAYLANLQSKTTLSMIADGLERSVRDFDNFLEDNVTMEWESQRKHIYEHFGIKVKDDVGPALGSASFGESQQGGFGRSRRSKAQRSTMPPGTKSAAHSRLATSLHRSVLGTPSRIGSHQQSDFTDVTSRADPHETTSGTALDDRFLRDKQGKLAEQVHALNVCRIKRQPFAALHHFAEVESKYGDRQSNQVVQAYKAVMDMVGENVEGETELSISTTKEREFAKAYLDPNQNAPDSVDMRKRILAGATNFLEKQFFKEVEDFIAKFPRDATLGGRPDVASKIKAYIRIRASRKDLVPDNTHLQQVNDEYIWAIIFYLLRSGHVREAANYVNNCPGFRSIDRTFGTYLNDYASRADRRLKKGLQDRCNNEYNQRLQNGPKDSFDPFRMACYKIVGRCQLQDRSLPGLNTDVDDWTWLQFNLAREMDRASEIASEMYTLSNLQEAVKDIGQKHFPKNPTEDSNGSYGMFFYLQILAGMFEQAVSYLYNFSYVDAIHFAIGLEYYGLLRASDHISSGNNLLSINTREQAQINFGRMLGYYTRDFRAADVIAAVDYLVLICLNMDQQGEAGQVQASLCHEALRELVLETREFSKLIGDIKPTGYRIPGVIEEYSELIGLGEEDDFVRTVTLQAANFADENGRTTDSVLLYHLAGDYDSVISIVSRALSEAISIEIGEDPMRLVPVKPRVAGDTKKPDVMAGSSLGLASIDDPVELARTMMDMYERDAMFHGHIQHTNKAACRVLLSMSEIKKLVEEGKWAESLDRISKLDILPLKANGDPSQIRYFASRFSAFPQSVAINVPNLLLWTIVCCTQQRDKMMNGQYSSNEGTRKQIVEQMRQISLDLTAYTSQLKYRFPPHLHEALARASAD